MPDAPVSPERSALMSRVRQKDTGPELAVRRCLHGLGYRFRLQSLPTCPVDRTLFCQSIEGSYLCMVAIGIAISDANERRHPKPEPLFGIRSSRTISAEIEITFVG